MMAESQPLSAAPDGAEYLRAVLRAPVYEAVQVTPLQKMDKLSSRLENVILVTDARQMPRAVWCFEKQGIAVHAAPCGSRAGKAPSLNIMWILPTYLSLTDTQAGFREWTGSLWYWLKGRI